MTTKKKKQVVKLSIESELNHLTDLMRKFKLKRLNIEGVELELHECAFVLDLPPRKEQTTEEIRKILSGSEFDGEICACGHSEDDHMGPTECIRGCTPFQCIKHTGDPDDESSAIPPDPEE